MYLEHLSQSKDSKESTKKQQKPENRKQIFSIVRTIVTNSTMSFENRWLDCVIHAKSYFYHKGKWYEVGTFKSQTESWIFFPDRVQGRVNTVSGIGSETRSQLSMLVVDSFCLWREIRSIQLGWLSYINPVKAAIFLCCHGCCSVKKFNAIMYIYFPMAHVS